MILTKRPLVAVVLLLLQPLRTKIRAKEKEIINQNGKNPHVAVNRLTESPKMNCEKNSKKFVRLI